MRGHKERRASWMERRTSWRRYSPWCLGSCPSWHLPNVMTSVCTRPCALPPMASCCVRWRQFIWPSTPFGSGPSSNMRCVTCRRAGADFERICTSHGTVGDHVRPCLWRPVPTSSCEPVRRARGSAVKRSEVCHVSYATSSYCSRRAYTALRANCALHAMDRARNAGLTGFDLSSARPGAPPTRPISP